MRAACLLVTLLIPCTWAAPSGEEVYKKRCSGCHEQVNPRIPPREALEKMPSAHILRALLKAIDRAGADVLEVGVPFSDPLADGPVIQRASERALANGANLREALALIGRVRHEISAPIVLFSYANPLLRMGLEFLGMRLAQFHGCIQPQHLHL